MRVAQLWKIIPVLCFCTTRTQKNKILHISTHKKKLSIFPCANIPSSTSLFSQFLSRRTCPVERDEDTRRRRRPTHVLRNDTGHDPVATEGGEMREVDGRRKRIGQDDFRVLLIFLRAPESDLVRPDLTVALPVSHGLEKGGRQHRSE